MTEIWAKIDCWDEKQHYKKRDASRATPPPWIKLHYNLIDSEKFQTMPLSSKALAPQLWLLASRYNGSVNIELNSLQWKLRGWSKEEISEGLKPLIDKGYLILSSASLEPCYSKYSTEKESNGCSTQEEKKNPDSPTGESVPIPQKSTEKKQADQLKEAFGKYQDLAKRLELPIPMKFTAKRKSQLKARLTEVGDPDVWDNLLSMIESQPFLHGCNARGWRVDFDFAVSPSGFQKILEDKYSQSEKATTNGRATTNEFRSAVVDAIIESREPD